MDQRPTPSAELARKSLGERVSDNALAESTEDGKKSAMAFLDKWLISKNWPKYDDWCLGDDAKKDFFCDTETFDAFAMFMLEFPVERKNPHAKDGEPKKYYCAMEFGTVLQYLSGVKESIKRDFPNEDLWKEETKWYKALRATVKRYWKRRALNNHDAFFTREPCVGNEEVTAICKNLLIRSKDVFDPLLQRAYIVANLYFAGRTSEGSLWSWEHWEWVGPVGTFVVTWPEMKTLELKPYAIVSNPLNFENDLLHALASAYVVGGGGHCLPSEYDHDSFSVFPQLTQQNAGSTLTSIIQGCAMRFDSRGSKISGVDGIDLGMGPKGMRIGKVAEILSDPSTDTYLAQLWGGWGEESGNMSNYVRQTLKSSLIAAKAGYNYHNPRARSFLPDPSAFMNNDNKVEIEGFMSELFRANHCDLMHGQHHLVTRRLCGYFLATLVMHLDMFIARYGVRHILVRQMLEVGAQRKVGGRFIDLALLKEWGELVKVRFDNENAVTATNPSDYSGALTAMSRQIGLLARENSTLKEDLSQMKSIISQL